MQATDSFRLNQDLIKNCNAESDFNVGDVISQEAANTYKGFDNMIKNFGELNKRQADYISKRQAEWKSFIEQFYNEELIRRSKVIPIEIIANVTLERYLNILKFMSDTETEIKRLSN